MMKKMLYKYPLVVGMITLLAPALSAQTKNDKIYHYSTMDAMRNSIYTGDISVKEIKLLGDFGLGTFNNLDGEMIVLDGKVYRILTDGTIEQADDKRLSPFLSVTHFQSEMFINLGNVRDFTQLQEQILHHLPSQNRFYAVKIDVMFEDVTVGGATKVGADESKGIAELMKSRPIYRKENVKGTIVGFFSPSYVGGIDLSPFHFHFISDDRTFGGHLIKGRLIYQPIKVYFDSKSNYEVILPKDNIKYNKIWKTSDSKSQY